ncbi:MAG: hypothetical protein JWO59_2906, partial [Chloroflexi bacterium]|nr:hypothetical protein [Chloroflexota bacterium]
MMGKHQLAWCPVLASIVLGALPAGSAGATSARLVSNRAEGVVIPTVLGPVTGAVDEQRGRIFLARRDTTPGQVSVLDARSDLILRSVSVGPAPSAMAVDEQADRVFVVSTGGYPTPNAGSVATLDAASGKVLRIVPAGTLPNAVAVDARSRHAVITTLTARGAAVEVLDVRTGAVLVTTLLGGQIRPIAVAAGDGRAIVVTSDDRVSIIDAACGRVLRALQAGQGAAAVALDSTLGHAFIVNQISNTVSMLDVLR